MSNQIVRTQEEIDRVLNWAVEGANEGTRFPSEPYENGIIYMWEWLIGESDEAPGED